MSHAVQTKFHERKTSSCLAVNTTDTSGNILSASREKTSDADGQMGCRCCARLELQPTRGATPSLCKNTSEHAGTKHEQKNTGKNNFYVESLSSCFMCCFQLPVSGSLTPCVFKSFLEHLHLVFCTLDCWTLVISSSACLCLCLDPFWMICDGYLGKNDITICYFGSHWRWTCSAVQI